MLSHGLEVVDSLVGKGKLLILSHYHLLKVLEVKGNKGLGTGESGWEGTTLGNAWEHRRETGKLGGKGEKSLNATLSQKWKLSLVMENLS